ncbi:hypothetical protein [Reichenbachiella sp. MALMAid0571]|uniref:hypothetical protein n=1 Tax=Reichenbachiella sp. MALMAid0571 TaxID=3143939 RepID=UPI0032DED943
MKQVTLNIPDSKYQFFIELVKNLGFDKAEELDIIPEEHKAIVRERSLKSKENPDRLLDWDQVQDNFRFD